MMYVVLNGNLVKNAASVQSETQIPAGALKVIASGTPAVDEVLVAGRPNIRDLCQMMLSGSSLVERPTLPDPTRIDNVVTLSGLPLGTLIEVIDVSGDEVMLETSADTDNWGDTITLTENGTYEIELLPPAPHLPLTFRFEVSGQ